MRVTFEPDALLDLERLDKAVRDVDFTPTGIRVWIRGNLAPDETAIAFTASGTGQRFVLAADDPAGEAVLQTLRLDPSAIVTIYGTATAGAEVDAITLHLEGVGEHP